MTLVELIQLLYSSESNKVHALKCTQSIQKKFRSEGRFYRSRQRL